MTLETTSPLNLRELFISLGIAKHRADQAKQNWEDLQDARLEVASSVARTSIENVGALLAVVAKVKQELDEESQKINKLQTEILKQLEQIEFSTLSTDDLWELLQGIRRNLAEEQVLQTRALDECRSRLEKTLGALGIEKEALKDVSFPGGRAFDHLVVTIDSPTSKTELVIREYLMSKRPRWQHLYGYHLDWDDKNKATGRYPVYWTGSM